MTSRVVFDWTPRTDTSIRCGLARASGSFFILLLIEDLRFTETCVFYRGRHLSYQRGKRNTNPNTSLIKIGKTDPPKTIRRHEGVENSTDAAFYNGKRVAFVYRASKEARGSKIRVIWGKVTRPHGNSGVVRAQFRNNLPPKSFGASVRIMLYPSSI
ncbi:60S ribosomal protein L33B [Botryosphaeria dothidea]